MATKIDFVKFLLLESLPFFIREGGFPTRFPVGKTDGLKEVPSLTHPLTPSLIQQGKGNKTLQMGGENYLLDKVLETRKLTE